MDWVGLAPSAVGAVAAGAAWWTLRQKINSDNRAEWWKRYTWAVDLMDKDVNEATFHLETLAESPLATNAEAVIVQKLLSQSITSNNGDNTPTEQEGQEDEEAHSSPA